MARRALEETWLRFAKGAAMIAIVLSGLAYASNNVSAGRLGQGARQARDGANGAGKRVDGLSLRAPAADELKQHLAPVRARAVLGEIDALPGAERKLAAGHRHMQRHAVEHRLHVRRHVVRAFGIVHPSGIRRREPLSAVTRSICTSGSAFSWMTSEAEVWRI